MDNLTVVIPFYNGHQYINNLIASLPSKLPIIIVDDLSDSPLQNSFHSNVQVHRLEKKGYFTGACNWAIRACNTDVLILNQDVVLDGTGWLSLLEQNRKEYALIGERIKGINPAFPHGYVHGVFMFMRRDAIEQVGLMDEENYPLWGSTALWQLQVCRGGFKALPVENVPGLYHARGNASFGSSIQELLRKEKRNYEKLISIPPEISVIIPCYNHGRFLQDAIHSLIGGETCLGVVQPQTYQSFEIIIINDGSTDDSGEIAESLADSWKGIRVIHQKNQGTAAAHNTGINQALGRYITCMSADDMREPWAIEVLYNAIKENPHSLVYDRPRILVNGQLGRKWPLEEYDFETLLYKNMVPVGTIFTKKAWEEVGGYPPELKHGREDWGFAIAMGRKGYCGLKIDRPGYLYRQHEHNRIKRNTTSEWKSFFLGQMAELFPDLYRGKRDMSCCGGGRSAQSSPKPKGQSSVAPQYVPGTTGMVLLEYVGKSAGSQEWRGPTGTTYIFGNNIRDKKKLVDEKDLRFFLGKRERYGGGVLFRQVVSVAGQIREVPPSVEVPEPVVEESALEEYEHQVEEMGKEFVEEEFDPSGYTISQIKGMGFTDQELAAVYEKEKKGLNRITLLSYLEEKMGG